ncbi:MAG TPA: aminopeptidase [Ignavibacteria bacterium]|nr:aminopeptidase [Ignavibacteria bacterium]
MSSTVTSIQFDEALSEGAYNAINVCLKLEKKETITLITDNDSMEIAASLVNEISKIGSNLNFFILEDYSPRPLKQMPHPVLDGLAESNVSIFCALAKEGELKSRIEMTNIIDSKKIRHGHMVNINKQIMLEAMRADFNKVDEISRRLIDKARKAKIIKVKSGGGTDLTAEFSRNLKWLKTSGLISVEKWGNLPGGEIFTSPYNVNGTFVVDGVVGDWLCQKYGDLKDNPLKIEIKDSRIIKMECTNTGLLEDFTAYTMTDDNSNRVGEFAIGTNIAIKHVIGHILQDEKLPTVHIAFGHPYSKHTGAKWESTTHIDCVSVKCSVWFDDEPVMENGEFLV